VEQAGRKRKQNGRGISMMVRAFLVALLASATLASAQLSILNSSHPVPFGFFGRSIASVPDCDGDGIADVVVGARFEDTDTVFMAGRAYVYSGRTGALLHKLRSPNAETEGNFGETVAGVPDVDGDGRGDVLIGAPDEDPGGASTPDDAGRVYLFSGRTGLLLRQFRSPVQQADGEFGSAVAGLPDFDGDGRGDIAIGAEDETAGADPARCGRVYLYSGRTGGFVRSLRPPSPQLGGQFGASLAVVPDTNGDGKFELLVGARGENAWHGTTRAGRAHLYASGTWHRLREFNSPGRELDGRFGYAVGGVMDLDGDGRGEVVIGAPREDPGTSPEDIGRTYVFSGRTGRLLFNLLPPAPEPFAEFGSSVAGLWDVTGDGRPDIAVGAWNHQFPGHPNNCGYVHVYSGANGQRVLTLAAPLRTVNGGFGVAVAGSPDTNGNGLGEILIGASGEGIGPSGRAYIWRR
jgi:hypothetical protein